MAIVKEDRSEETRSSKFGRAPTSSKHIAFVAAAIVLIGLGFASGVLYQKSQATNNKKSYANNNQSNGTSAPGLGGQNGLGGRRRFGGQRPVVGQVSAIDAGSITIKDQAGANQTFTITDATTVSDQGQAATIAGIKTGDTVAIIASTADSKQAARVLLNPNLGSMAPPASTNTPNSTSIN